MSITNIVRDATSVLISRAASGGSQNFLGARWVETVIERSPERVQERLALRLLSLSPHYFYAHDVRGEDQRNRRSRQNLTELLLAPYLNSAMQVLDYGCGPGYMACAMAEWVSHVDAVDISRGVLACARVLNNRPNITYLRPDDLRREGRKVDLAYSFAVAQHLTAETLMHVLDLIAYKVRQGGLLLLHFAVPAQGGYRTEREWGADQSILGRVKMRYLLNCFGRSAEDMEALVSVSGFTDIEIRSLRGTITVPGDDDVVQQHLLTARRK